MERFLRALTQQSWPEHPPRLTMLSGQPRKLQELIGTIKIHDSTDHTYSTEDLEGFSSHAPL